jgi:hypothetical protein
MRVRRKTIQRSGRRWRISGLRGVIRCGLRRKMSSGRCVWSSRSSDTMFLVGYPFFLGVTLDILTGSSSCVGREAQEGEERKVASYAWQFSKAGSWNINSVFICFGWEWSLGQYRLLFIWPLLRGFTSVVQHGFPLQKKKFGDGISLAICSVLNQGYRFVRLYQQGKEPGKAIWYIISSCIIALASLCIGRTVQLLASSFTRTM